jgi:cell division protein FtsQ
MAKRRENGRDAEPGGLWHQPALMNLLADLLIVLSTAALAWSALTALQRLPLFPLRELALAEKPVRLGADQIEHTARTAVVGNFFTVDLEGARTAFEKLPWVRKATVQRQWPGTLALKIEEHQPLARWRHLNGNLALVNGHGEIFVAELAEDAASLPLLSGPEGSAPEMLKRHDEFSASLAAIGRRPDSITLSPRMAWHLKLDDGTAVELGREQEQTLLHERLARFVTYYDTLKNRQGRFQVADMRYPNGFALTAGRKS